MDLCSNRVESPREHLALDEALLEHSQSLGGAAEWLRVWEVDCPTVVVGRGGRIKEEVELSRCLADGVPVLRRATGGGAVLLGPGCLVYSVVLSIEQRPFLQHIHHAHRWVLTQLQQATSACGWDTVQAGTSDLAWQGRKCSGNSMKLKSHALLYHGTLLYRAPLDQVARYLRHPPREPDYRAGRPHPDFVTNLPIDPARLTAELIRVFGAHRQAELPQPWIAHWMSVRYGQPSWHETGRITPARPTPNDAATPTPDSANPQTG